MKEPEPVPAQTRLAELCRALGHPVRVAIVAHLLAVDTCLCGQIVDRFDLAQSTVSQHLKILKEAGLVKGRIEAPRICYCLDRRVVAEFRGLVGRLAGPAPDE